jgi:hypothetical protein
MSDWNLDYKICSNGKIDRYWCIHSYVPVVNQGSTPNLYYAM